MKLIAVILTLNEAEHIHDCIAQLGFSDAVLVFDSFSTDNTIEIAQNNGAIVIQNTFLNYTDQRNRALESAQQQGADWVLFVDADERITEALAQETFIAMQTDTYAGYQIPRHNYIFGKLTQGAGWYPDYQTRLLRIGKAHYDPGRQVHEVVILDGELGTLQNPIIHYNYRDMAHFADKQRKYARYEAQVLFEQGIRPKIRNYILQPYREFKRRYFALKGYQDGFHGLRLCWLMAWYELRKYLMLRDMWRQAS